MVTPPGQGIKLTLRPYPTTDNPSYQWYSSTDPQGALSCLHCMVAFPEWQAGAHAQSAMNPRFFSMYNGTDINGTVPITPGYKLDLPGTAGNCANCHAPGAGSRFQGAFTADMNGLRAGAEREGVFCEFCHKILDVYLNPATGLPYPNAPGVLSYRLVRTSGANVLFLGPLDDVTRRVSFLPLEKKSQFCAACHQFSFWGTPIYESFKEWKESPYPARGIECQTCHMPPETVPYFVFPQIAGSLVRDPSTLASHLDLGVKDPDFMRKTVAMTVTAQITGTNLSVAVSLTNVFAGHHVPTDYPGRNMILVVRVTDGDGQPCEQSSGPVVPDWGGLGALANDYAGQAGKGYAKILRDRETGQWPVISYWKQAFIHSDNRIPAGATDVSYYEFRLPGEAGAHVASLEGRDLRNVASIRSLGSSEVHVEATLWFRRLFIAQAREKGWDTPDLDIAHAEAVFPVLIELESQVPHNGGEE